MENRESKADNESKINEEENRCGRYNFKMSIDEFLRAEEIYKMFGSIPRLKIILRLRDGECTVGEICDICGLSQSATSHQLRDLKHARIIKSRKVGLNVYYRLFDNHIVKIIESGIEHIKGDHCHE